MDNNEKMWGENFGLEYSNRQNINYKNRRDIWERIISKLEGINSVLEIGSNQGHNLDMIRSIYHEKRKNSLGFAPISVLGVEINKEVASRSTVPTVICSAYQTPLLDRMYGLVFTSGVLIHLEDTLKAMKEIFRLSGKYILSIEYFDDKERKIEYRDGVYCSAKPFDRLWLDNFDLGLVELGNMKDFNLDDGTDFSRNCKYAIFKKP